MPNLYAIIVPKSAIEEAKRALEEAKKEAEEKTNEIIHLPWAKPSNVVTLFKTKIVTESGTKKFDYVIIEDKVPIDYALDREALKTYIEDILRDVLNRKFGEGQWEVIYLEVEPDTVDDPTVAPSTLKAVLIPLISAVIGAAATALARKIISRQQQTQKCEQQS